MGVNHPQTKLKCYKKKGKQGENQRKNLKKIVYTLVQ